MFAKQFLHCGHRIDARQCTESNDEVIDEAREKSAAMNKKIRVRTSLSLLTMMESNRRR